MNEGYITGKLTAIQTAALMSMRGCGQSSQSKGVDPDTQQYRSLTTLYSLLRRGMVDKCWVVLDDGSARLRWFLTGYGEKFVNDRYAGTAAKKKDPVLERLNKGLAKVGLVVSDTLTNDKKGGKR